MKTRKYTNIFLILFVSILIFGCGRDKDPDIVIVETDHDNLLYVTCYGDFGPIWGPGYVKAMVHKNQWSSDILLLTNEWLTVYGDCYSD